ncbi:hypothetical protein QJS66_06800 [Kocuria rhizophila]|nr:hypothetical protein QJS66_06800 [Kocuria rhizophila]
MGGLQRGGRLATSGLPAQDAARSGELIDLRRPGGTLPGAAARELHGPEPPHRWPAWEGADAGPQRHHRKYWLELTLAALEVGDPVALNKGSC